MTITYTTKVESINTYKVLNNLQTVIFYIKFNRTGVSTDGYTATYHDWLHLPEPDAATFIPFSQLTEAQVIGWIEAARPDFNPAAEQYIAMKIEEERGSNIVQNQTLPW